MIPAVYAVIPRGRSPEVYISAAADVTSWAVTSDFDGILFFTGSGAHIDPWISAVSLIAQTERVTPMIAVNPVYMHPVTAARFVNSIACLYSRAVALNFVAGTSLSEMGSVGDNYDHGARYRRVEEYAHIMRRLLEDGRPVDWAGEFYRLSKVQVLPILREELLPSFFLAGSSTDAQRVSASIGASMIGMLALGGEDPGANPPARHFGVITRPETETAWTRAHECFPADAVGAAAQEFSMRNTDAVWKASLMSRPDPGDDLYWMAPFRNGHADCPYVVANYARVAQLIGRLGASGVHTVIIDVPARKEDFEHLASALSLARRMEH